MPKSVKIRSEKVISTGSKQELSKSERDELTRNEGIVEKGMHTFIEVGQALLRIKEGQLYREKHPSFENYCRNKFDISRIHAYRLVNAAEVCALLPNGETPQPANESQVRPLTSIPRDQVPAVWMNAVRKAGTKAITAKTVRAAVSEVKPRGKKKSKIDPPSHLHWQDVCLQKLKKVVSLVDHEEPNMALHELEGVKLIIEQVALKTFSSSQDD